MGRFAVATALVSAVLAQGVAAAAVASASASGDGIATTTTDKGISAMLKARATTAVNVDNVPSQSPDPDHSLSLGDIANSIVSIVNSPSAAIGSSLPTTGATDSPKPPSLSHPPTSGLSISVSDTSSAAPSHSTKSDLSVSVESTSISSATSPSRTATASTITSHSGTASPSGSKSPITTHLPEFTFNGQTFTADSSSDFFIDGQTLRPGSMIMVSGAQIYWPSGASEVVLGASTQSMVTSLEWHY
ncbi:MAG: hypothetical protein Q9165_008450 [Trypethelium subeluteriae]